MRTYTIFLLWTAALLDSIRLGSSFLSSIRHWYHHNHRCSWINAACADGTTTSKVDVCGSSPSSLWKQLVDRFQGDFDNYQQVLEDRRNGLLPREGGGHENFHCTLIPVSPTGRLAAFYFDGNPQRIFRFRYYELLMPPSDNAVLEMRLHTLHPDLETLLRTHSKDPIKWPDLFDGFQVSSPFDESLGKINYLPNCEVAWSFDLDPDQHSYEMAETNGIHAVMVHGEAIVDSTVIPGIQIRILDQLSLFEDVFYINDRGFDPKTGAFLYGNQRGVPYRLERVTSLNGQGNERRVLNDDLQWTMGPQWRDEEEYEEKIRAIGGPSAVMSRPGPPKK